MRPGDWVKNVFVLLPAVFVLAQRVPGADATGGGAAAGLDASSVIGRSLAAFAAFCLAASGFYAINDALDAEEDRRHPVKRTRPVASGTISPRAAIVFGTILEAGAVTAALATSRGLAAVLGIYLLLQVGYNVLFKRFLLVDVIAVATGFGVRAAAGAVAIPTQLSIWLLLCVFFLCLYLGFIKRLCDLASATSNGDGTWRSPAGYDDRTELSWLLGVTGGLAIVTYLMYALSSHAAHLFGVRARGLALLIPFVLIAIHRFFRRASRGATDSPLEVLLEDRAVLASVVLFAAGVAAVLYVPAVARILDDLFVAE
jgi:4-hydroxybenzoate polyprenyltransferase